MISQDENFLRFYQNSKRLSSFLTGGNKEPKVLRIKFGRTALPITLTCSINSYRIWSEW